MDDVIEEQPLIQAENVSPFSPEYDNDEGDGFFINNDFEVDDIEEENDPEFIHDVLNVDDEHQLKNESFIYQGSYLENDIFIMVFEEDEQFYDRLVTIEEIKPNSVIIKDEEDNTFELELDDESNIINETENYKIIDIEKVKEFNFEEMNEFSFEVEDYKQIELDVIERKDRKYTLQERKEDFITEMISSMKLQDDNLKKKQISEIAENYTTMIQNKDKLNTFSSIPFINDILNQSKYNFPKWILPISDNQKKLYIEKKEDETPPEDTEDNIHLSIEEEIFNKVKIFDDVTTYSSYRKQIKSLKNFKPYNPKLNKGLLIQYDGEYFRNCSKENPCQSVLLQPYDNDIVKTRKAFKIPITKDFVTERETLVQKEDISIVGFHTIPYTLYNKTLSLDNTLSLNEICEPLVGNYDSLSDNKYSTIPFTKQFKNYENKYSHVIGVGLDKPSEWLNGIHTYFFDDTITSNVELANVLKDSLPLPSEILETYSEEIKKCIVNHDDISKLLLPYNISFNEMIVDERIKMNELIEKNIKLMKQRHSEIKYSKSPTKQKQLLTFSDRIKLSRDFISSIVIDSVRNKYFKQFIDTFSRKANDDEDQRFLYEKDGTKKLLCTHYNYSIKCHNDIDVFKTMKSKYGEPEKDGIIYCKVCGEYLCHADFSTLEGFGGEGRSQIQNTREVMVTDNEEELNLLKEEEMNIKKLIQKLSNSLGIKLNYNDTTNIINYVMSTETNNMTDVRYGIDDALKQHPKYLAIKEKYKSTKKDDKAGKKAQNAELKPYKQYIIDCNHLMIVLFLILFYLQTSIPPYQVKTKEYIYLWESFDIGSWDQIKNSTQDMISINTVDKMIILVKKVSQMNSKQSFWKNINEYLTESDKYKDLNTITDQFFLIASHILKDLNIRNKLKEYYYFKLDEDRVFLKEYWSTYKPLPDNPIVESINNNLQEQLKTDLKKVLLKNGSSINYENISSVREINFAIDTPLFKLFNIPYSEILKNESYKRLFTYCIHLHGKSKNQTQLNLLINQFINTIDDRQKMEALFTSIGWDVNTKKLNEVNYTLLRTVVVKDITDYYKKKNTDDEVSIRTFIHIGFNNWNGMLLNSLPKRDYTYEPPNVFPFESFQELIDYGKSYRDKKQENEKLIDYDILESLFNKFGINKEDQIVDKYITDSFIDNIVPDPEIFNIRRNVNYKELTINEENFYKIIDHIVNKNKLRLLKRVEKDEYIYENKLKKFIKANKLLESNADETYPIFRNLYDLPNMIKDSKPEVIEEKYREIFNSILEYNDSKIENIKDFFISAYSSENITEEQIKRFRKKYGSLEKRLFDSVPLLFNKFIENSPNLHNDISTIKYILGRLSISAKNQEKGTYIHDYIPKQWKLSDTIKDYMKSYINHNEFLFHDETFLNQRDQKKLETRVERDVRDIENTGFNKYKDVDVSGKDKYSSYFKALSQYFENYYQKGIHDLDGSDNSYFTEEYSSLFKRFMFIFLFNKLIEYVESLYDEQSEISQIANEIFVSLQEQDRLNLNDSIKICSQFVFDIFSHLFEAYYDPFWIYQTKDLTNKLSKQREKEKQSLINDFESKDADARLATTDMQKYGITNWWGNFSEQNLKNQETDRYKDQMDDERKEQLKELFYQNQSELEAMEALGLNTDHMAETQEEVYDEGYDQDDQDREDEGDDDADDDGDYHEN